MWRPFGATNKPGTCLWCGAKLRGELYKKPGPDRRLGDYGDGFVCGLRCGYQLGVMFARLGRRLMPKEDET